MIARTWRGSVRARDAESYVEYLERTGFAAYASTPGNLGAIGLRRRRGECAEFLLISLWDSQGAIQRFAGERPERAVFFPADERFLIKKDDHVDHFEVVHLSAPGQARSDGPGDRGPLGRLADSRVGITAASSGVDAAADPRPSGWKVIRLP